MVGITDRNRMKNELASIGYTLSYIDDWQPKTTLYRHKPSYHVNGGIAADTGTFIKGVPGNPDYVLRKAKIGLFPWKPSSECDCKWCVERTIEGSSDHCDLCDFVPKGESPKAINSSLRMHVFHKHKDSLSKV